MKSLNDDPRVGGGTVARATTVGSVLEDNYGTLLHLLSELRDLESALGVVLVQRPPAPTSGNSEKADPPFLVLDRLLVTGEGLRFAVAHVQELRQRLVL